MLLAAKNKVLFVIIRLKKSFSLIELSVVLSIIGILSSISLHYALNIFNKMKYEKNKQKIEKIKVALNNYFQLNGRLPAPTNNAITNINDSNFGKENLSDLSGYTLEVDIYTTTKIMTSLTDGYYQKQTYTDNVFYGFVPYKELNLNIEDISDIYGNLIEYYVPKVLCLPIIQPSFNTFTKIGYTIKEGSNISSDKDYPCDLETGTTAYNCDKLNENEQNYAVKFVVEIPPSSSTKNITEYNYEKVPYHLMVNNVKDYLLTGTKTNITPYKGSVAYVLLSHGENGIKTCSSKNNKKLKQINRINQNNGSLPEKEMCNLFKSSSSVSCSSTSCLELNFYQGEAVDGFDDVVIFENLGDLLKDYSIL